MTASAASSVQHRLSKASLPVPAGGGGFIKRMITRSAEYMTRAEGRGHRVKTLCSLLYAKKGGIKNV